MLAPFPPVSKPATHRLSPPPGCDADDDDAEGPEGRICSPTSMAPLPRLLLLLLLLVEWACWLLLCCGAREEEESWRPSRRMDDDPDQPKPPPPSCCCCCAGLMSVTVAS